MKMFNRKLIWIIALAGLILLLVGCGISTEIEKTIEFGTDIDATVEARITSIPTSTPQIVFDQWNQCCAINLIDPNGSNLIRLIDDPRFLSYAEWSPDGSKILYLAYASEEETKMQLYVMNADGSNVTRVIDYGPITQVHVHNPDW